MDEDTGNRLLTTEEVARELRVSTWTVSAWRRAGGKVGPPWIEIGGQIRYSRDAFEGWLSAQTQGKRA